MSEPNPHLPITSADGIDVTVAVQILYDIAHSSMDWGSGFLDNEEVETVIDMAVALGFRVPDLPDNSEPMVTVAQKYPDHYEITWVDHPGGVSGGSRWEPWSAARIKVKEVTV